MLLMKIQIPIILTLLIVITSCAHLGMPPDPLKNCEQLRITIQEVKEDIASKVPYDSILYGDNMAENMVRTAMLVLAVPMKELVLARVDELDELIERYRNLLKYSYEKECGHEYLEAQSLINKIKSTRTKIKPE